MSILLLQENILLLPGLIQLMKTKAKNKTSNEKNLVNWNKKSIKKTTMNNSTQMK